MLPTERTLDTDLYDQHRKQIRNGDILCFSGQHWLSAFIRRLSHGRYSHAGLAFWWGERLMVLQAEARPGVQALPASRAIDRYRGQVDWVPLKDEHRTPEFEAKLTEVAMELLGDPYSILDLVRVGFHYLIRTPLPKQARTPHTFVCAQYVAYCYSASGLDLEPRKPDIGTTPEEIARSKYHGPAVRLKR